MSDKKKKPFTKREKTIAAVVTATIAAAPLLAIPAYEASAVIESPIPSSGPCTNAEMRDFIVTLSDEFQPVNLRSCYGGEINSILSSDPTVAVHDEALLKAGYLSIVPKKAGQATFLVTALTDGITLTDEFTVNVVPTSSDSKLNIGDILNYFKADPESIDTREEIEHAISFIKPTKLDMLQSTNHAPVYAGNMPIDSMVIGEKVLFENLGSYFDDPEGNELEFTVLNSNENVISLVHEEDYSFLEAVAEGTSEVKFLVSDGQTVKAFPFMITVSANQPTIVNNFDEFHLSYGGQATVNLNDFFVDPDATEKRELTYSYVSLSSGSEVGIEYPLAGSFLTIKNSYSSKIQKVIAIDSSNERVEQGVTIVTANEDPFDYASIFDNSILDIKLGGKFDVDIQDYVIKSDNPNVTAAVYNDNYIRISGNTLGEEGTKIEVTGRNSETRITYGDVIDLNKNETWLTGVSILSLDEILPYYIEEPNEFDFNVTSSNSNISALITGGSIQLTGTGSTTITLRYLDEFTYTFDVVALPSPG
jgi:hypothetical protein